MALLGTFFTATSMIGFIAGAGIVVRNSIILVDFAELKLREGMPLAAAVEEAVLRTLPADGAHRARGDRRERGHARGPHLPGARRGAHGRRGRRDAAVSRYAVPVLYFMLARHGRAAELQREGAVAASAPARLPATLPAANAAQAKAS